jgi:hypothetical protein
MVWIEYVSVGAAVAALGVAVWAAIQSRQTTKILKDTHELVNTLNILTIAVGIEMDYLRLNTQGPTISGKLLGPEFGTLINEAMARFKQAPPKTK